LAVPLSLERRSPESTVTFVRQSRCSSAVSLPAKPPYTATPVFMVKNTVREVPVVGL